jgi:hypothetical protein
MAWNAVKARAPAPNREWSEVQGDEHEAIL